MVRTRTFCGTRMLPAIILKSVPSLSSTMTTLKPWISLPILQTRPTSGSRGLHACFLVASSLEVRPRSRSGDKDQNWRARAGISVKVKGQDQGRVKGQNQEVKVRGQGSMLGALFKVRSQGSRSEGKDQDKS